METFGRAYGTLDSRPVSRGEIKEIFANPIFIKSDAGVHGCAIAELDQ